MHHTRSLRIPHQRKELIRTGAGLGSNPVDDVRSARADAKNVGRGGILDGISASIGNLKGEIGDDGVANYDAEFPVGLEVGFAGATGDEDFEGGAAGGDMGGVGGDTLAEVVEGAGGGGGASLGED